MLWARGRQSAEETERKGCEMLDARPRYRPTVSHPSDNPTELSVNSLIARLKSDLATRGLSPKNHAHRSRVIRQQAELLARNSAAEADEQSRQLAKRQRKASRPPDHRETGGES